MQKLTIEGSPARLKTILSFIEKLDAGNAHEDIISIPQTPVVNIGSVSSGLSEGTTAGPQTPAATTENTTEAKRTRRTKAEIEAEKNGPPAGAPPVVNDTKTDLVTQSAIARADGITMAEMKKFTIEKGQNHAQEIMAKLKEFGVSRAGELAEKDWNAYYIFLQAL